MSILGLKSSCHKHQDLSKQSSIFKSITLAIESQKNKYGTKFTS
jgi:hypothetical protein